MLRERSPASGFGLAEATFETLRQRKLGVRAMAIHIEHQRQDNSFAVHIGGKVELRGQL
jgi:hypothetical protein